MSHEKAVTVTIAGTTYTGKSTILALFHKALKEAGFTNTGILSPELTEELLTTLASDEHLQRMKEVKPEFFQNPVVLIEKNIGRFHGTQSAVNAERAERNGIQFYDASENPNDKLRYYFPVTDDPENVTIIKPPAMLGSLIDTYSVNSIVAGQIRAALLETLLKLMTAHPELKMKQFYFKGAIAEADNEYAKAINCQILWLDIEAEGKTLGQLRWLISQRGTLEGLATPAA